MIDNLTYRIAQLDDLKEIQKLFLDTINEICKADYNNDQIEAWTLETKNNLNQKRWQDAITKQFVIVAQKEGEIVGFITLDSGNYIDFLYVHKDYQRQGIANKLYKEIENEAKRLLQTFLTSDVSKTARPFFKKVGFEVLKEQTVMRQGVELTNYKMKKKLNNIQIKKTDHSQPSQVK